MIVERIKRWKEKRKIDFFYEDFFKELDESSKKYELIFDRVGELKKLNSNKLTKKCNKVKVVDTINQIVKSDVHQTGFDDKVSNLINASLDLQPKQKELIEFAIEKADCSSQKDLLKNYLSKGKESYNNDKYYVLDMLYEIIHRESSCSSDGLGLSIYPSENVKEFYAEYLKNKLYRYEEFDTLVFQFLKRNLNDELVRKKIDSVAFNIEYHKNLINVGFIRFLYSYIIDFKKKGGVWILDHIKDVAPELEDGDIKLITEKYFESIERKRVLPLSGLKKASSRYIYLVFCYYSDLKEGFLTVSQDCTSWKKDKIIYRFLKFLLENKERKLVVELYSCLSDEVKKNKNIESIYFSAVGLSKKGFIETNHALFHANKIYEEHNIDEAVKYFDEESFPHEVGSIKLLKASDSINDESLWVELVNSYLKTYKVTPISLKQGDGPLYQRITSATEYEVISGPLISVLMPAFNAEKYLIFSVESILNQTYKNIELIIVDDASSDSTWEIATSLAKKDKRIKTLRNLENVGPYVAKNCALMIADGEYITGHDADDWAHPQRLEMHLDHMLKKGHQVSITSMLRVRENGYFSRISKTGLNCYDGVISGAFISCMFERKYLKENFGFWDQARFAGDSELIRRIQAISKKPVDRFFSPGLICLDAPEGITNDPEHGYSPSRGLSKTRLDYRNSFNSLHNNIDLDTCYINFPQDEEYIPKPLAVSVPRKNIEININNFYKNIDTKRYFRNSDDCDICIITDLRFKGGNASSTLDEIRYFKSIGLKVVVIHCPTILSQGKNKSSRYDGYKDFCIDFHDVTSVNSKLVIVRHPLVITSKKFNKLMGKIKTSSLVGIINNSIFRPNGDVVYSIEKINEVFKRLKVKNKCIYPLGPAIRSEMLEQDLIDGSIFSDCDWSPTFDTNDFKFEPKESFGEVVKIGRHGRDGKEKWIESDSELLKIYPNKKDVEVFILGGADCVKKRLGTLPSNWTVLPFNSITPSKYLSDLDVFVYYPNTSLNEAFGRTIMEAIFRGVPCVLPKRFKETFGELAFYSDPEDVYSVIKRLSSKNEIRLKYLLALKEFAFNRYDSSVLVERICFSDEFSSIFDNSKKAYGNSLDPEQLDYKKWIETGCV